MVWDQDSRIIVMLTKLVEDNRLKCEQYWPEGKAMQYRDIVVTITSVKEMTDMTIKVFKLHKVSIRLRLCKPNSLVDALSKQFVCVWSFALALLL